MSDKIADEVPRFELGFDDLFVLSNAKLISFNKYMYLTSEIMNAEEVAEQDKKDAEVKIITSMKEAEKKRKEAELEMISSMSAKNDYLQYELWKEELVYNTIMKNNMKKIKKTKNRKNLKNK